MNCPYCGAASKQTRVVLTRNNTDKQKLRKRKCLACEEFFFSLESIVPKFAVQHAPHWGLRLTKNASDVHFS